MLTFFFWICIANRLFSCCLGACMVKVSCNAILFGMSSSNLSPFQEYLVHSTLPDDQDLVHMLLVEGCMVLWQSAMYQLCCAHPISCWWRVVRMADGEVGRKVCQGVMVFFIYWFGHTLTSNLSFLACQMLFPSLHDHPTIPTYQKKPMIKEEHGLTLMNNDGQGAVATAIDPVKNVKGMYHLLDLICESALHTIISVSLGPWLPRLRIWDIPISDVR